MSTRTHDALQAILMQDDLEDLLTPDQRDEIESLARMFRPYAGDPPEEVEQREKPLSLCCGNCKHVWPGPWMPAEMGKFATLTIRIACCPKCFATDRVMVGGAT